MALRLGLKLGKLAPKPRPPNTYLIPNIGNLKT
jgi:hypothetical protein